MITEYFVDQQLSALLGMIVSLKCVLEGVELLLGEITPSHLRCTCAALALHLGANRWARPRPTASIDKEAPVTPMSLPKGPSSFAPLEKVFKWPLGPRGGVWFDPNGTFLYLGKGKGQEVIASHRITWHRSASAE